MPGDLLPGGYLAFGSQENCTLSVCPVEWSILTYRPDLGANIAFAALFAAIGLVHVYLGWRWKSWGFMVGMILGCMSEILGYVGRIIMYNNPFSFIGFMIQIVCLTIAPVFFTASIYVTLSKSIVFLAPELSRFKPQLFYWVFIPFDVVCLTLQAAGGALSTTSSGQAGVSISKAGLGLQIAVLGIFCIFFADYMVRYMRSHHAVRFDWRMRAFYTGLVSAIVLIFARCAYRVAELGDGYNGSLFHDEIPFIILEGVVVLLAVISLCFGHPGFVFDRAGAKDAYMSRKAMEAGGNTPESTRSLQV